MKKNERTAAERIKETLAKAAPNPPPAGQPERELVPFGPDTVWIGANALKRLVEQTEELYPDDNSFNEALRNPKAGLRQVEDAVVQLQEVLGAHVRLIFGTPAKPLHKLSVSDVPAPQGVLDNDDIQKWIHAGASLIADARELTYLPVRGGSQFTLP